MISQPLYRIIDANMNRVKEGLRVIEEYVRLYAPNKQIMQHIRTMRHDLEKTAHTLYKPCINARDTRSDYGKDMKEGKRVSIESIIIANMKRVQEGLRVLEECSKIEQGTHAKRFKKMRFEMYDIEKKLYNHLNKL